MLYLTSDHFSFFLPLGLIGVFRYLWFIIRLLAAWSYKPIPIPLKPTYHALEDVTIVVPTIDSDSHFLTAMRSWLVSQPYEILIITTFAVLPQLERLAQEMNRQDFETNPELAKQGLLGRDGKGRVRVFGVERANKRKQMTLGIKQTLTDIIVFADDDAIWPRLLLSHVLASFEDLSIGGVGTSQSVLALRPTGKLTVWETLASFRLSIRNVEIAASSYLDGGVPCLSGRTAAYRSIILKDPEFMKEFTNDFWRGKYHLNSGDDKFLTRWCVSHGWKTWVQVCKGAELKSTMKDDWTFLKQVLRWTRNTWRSDLRSIFVERHIWTAHPYVAYSMIDKFLNPFTLLAGPALVIFLCARSASQTPIEGIYVLPVWNILISWSLWLTATRTAKLAPHLWNRPGDIVYVPVWVAFGYYFSVMKLYALFTLHEVGWGTRAGIDTNHDDSNSSPNDREGETKPIQSTTATGGGRSFDPSSPPPFPGVMASFPSQSSSSPSYHTTADVFTPTAPTTTTTHLESYSSSPPNPLPTSSPTSTYPASPLSPPAAAAEQHSITYGYLDSSPLSMDPLSPPRRHFYQPPLAHYQEQQQEEESRTSSFEKLQVPSATEEQWDEWERVTKQAMERFDQARRTNLEKLPPTRGGGEEEEEEDERGEPEGEEIRFGDHDEPDREGEDSEREELRRGKSRNEDGGIRIVY